MIDIPLIKKKKEGVSVCVGEREGDCGLASSKSIFVVHFHQKLVLKSREGKLKCFESPRCFPLRWYREERSESWSCPLGKFQAKPLTTTLKYCVNFPAYRCNCSFPRN